MDAPSKAGAVCAECQAPMGADGRCLTCLLRGGLPEETVVDPSRAPAVPPTAAGSTSTVYGDFEITRRDDGTLWELGRGAMGVTYRAVDRTLHRPVALKVIQFSATQASGSDLSVALRERFLREARAAAALRHANIAGVFHFGAADGSGQCYYAMELVEGETLEARVRRDGPLDADTALEVAAQVAAALVAAAGRGLIHRDLKPSNLMLSDGNTPAGVEVKVIDFGLAKAAATADEIDLTHGGFVGTPAFASPEQFERLPVDARTDIYSLGVTLWYTLTGRVPFAGKTFAELRFHPARQTLPVEQLTAKKVPPAVVALLGAMLAEDPEDRPASARELVVALENCRLPVADRTLPGGRKPGKTHVIRASVGLVLAGTGLAWWMARPLRQGVESVPVASGATASATPVVPEKSVAVLPFENLSDDKTNGYFIDGVQDEILTDLARIADLRVISRSSVMQYKSDAPRNLREIGVQLGVAHVLEGSVQRAGNRVRVTAGLIDTRTEAHQWAEHYDGDLADVFAIQSEIAQAIAGQLQAKISPQEKSAIDAPPTTDIEAFDLYLRTRDIASVGARYGQTADKLEEGVRLLEAALARDPKFLQAWCQLARVHGNIYFFGYDHTPARLEKFDAAVQAAVRLQPDSGETHLVLADYYYHGLRDYGRVAAEVELARRTLPNDAQIYLYSGYILRRQGHWTEAVRNFEQALTLDPRNYQTLRVIAHTYEVLRRFADTERSLLRALAIVPGDPAARLHLAQLPLNIRADIQPYQTALAAVLSDDPGLVSDDDDMRTALCERTPEAAARALAHLPPNGTATLGMVLPHAYWEGIFARCEGDAARARAAFTTARAEIAKVVAAHPDQGIAVSVLGLIDAGLGRKEEAIREGLRGCELMPYSKDALDGPVVATNLALIYAWTGEKAAAIEQLTAIERVPNDLQYGVLKLDPQWDDLRGDPRFEALVASHAPKPSP